MEVCRDLNGLTRLAALRRHDLFSETPVSQTLSAIIVPENSAENAAAASSAATGVTPASTNETVVSEPAKPSQPTDLEASVETPKNVLQFRPINEPKPPALTPVENSAFNELARQLSARLDSDNAAAATPAAPQPAGSVAELPPPPEQPEPASETPEWLAPPEPPARGEARRDKTLLNLVPVGVLIYRLDRLLYANRAFLERMGYDSLHALEEAGGLDALMSNPWSRPPAAPPTPAGR